MKNIQLNQRNLPGISKRIPVPIYDRDKVKCGIVHIGVGGFHRSHQAFYADQLLSQSQDMNWGICGIGLRSHDRKISEVFDLQDCLYTLITKDPQGSVQNRVVGSIVKYILAVDQQQQAIQQLAGETTKIVSLTITEGGYNINGSGEFDFENEDVRHDLENPDDPRSVFGFLTAALRLRKEAELPAFTLLSCDNIQHNGDVAKYVILAFARRQDMELANWIEANVSFPNSMVDRITPATTQQEIDFLKESYGLLDKWPVSCEPFIQWVIEDKFTIGRPEFEKLGAQFVQDVASYEKMKLRLLNAGHSVLGIPGAIHGHHSINACMEDPVFATFMRSFLDQEATPTLDKLPGLDLEDYKDKLAERFANPNIKDHVARICAESSAKIPRFLLPTLRDNLKNGSSIKYACLILATWCHYCDRQHNQMGEKLDIQDAMAHELHQAANGTHTDRLSFLRLEAVFGDLIDHDRLTKLYTHLVEQVYEKADIRKLMASFED